MRAPGGMSSPAAPGRGPGADLSQLIDLRILRHRPGFLCCSALPLSPPAGASGCSAASGAAVGGVGGAAGAAPTTFAGASGAASGSAGATVPAAAAARDSAVGAGPAAAASQWDVPLAASAVAMTRPSLRRPCSTELLQAGPAGKRETLRDALEGEHANGTSALPGSKGGGRAGSVLQRGGGWHRTSESESSANMVSRPRSTAADCGRALTAGRGWGGGRPRQRRRGLQWRAPRPRPPRGCSAPLPACTTAGQQAGRMMRQQRRVGGARQQPRACLRQLCGAPS